MAYIFNVDQTSSAKIFQAGQLEVTIGKDAKAATAAVMLGVTIQISRQLSPIPTINKGVMWSAQPPQGTLTAQSIVTDAAGTDEKQKNALEEMFTTDICTAYEISVSLKDKACTQSKQSGNTATASKGKTLQIHDAYVASVGYSVQAQQGYIANDVTINFTKAEIKDT